jgi:hypothetical protein
MCLIGEMTEMDEPGTRSWILVWGRRFSFPRRIQTSLEAHPASSLMGMATTAFLTRVKRPGLEADHLNLVSRLRVHGSIRTLPHTSSRHDASQGQRYLYFCCP